MTTPKCVKISLLEKLSILRMDVQNDTYDEATLQKIFDDLPYRYTYIDTNNVVTNKDVMSYLFRGWFLTKASQTLS